MTQDADVAVIGLGSVGAMALWRLASRGVDVVGIEQFNIGHDLAGAGGDTRIFRTAYFEGLEYVPLLQRAKACWRELEAASGRKLLHLTGGLMIGSPHSEALKMVDRCIQVHGLAHRRLDASTMRAEFPEHDLEPGEVAVLDENAGFLYSGLAVISAVEVAQAAGAKVVTDTVVESIRSDDGGVEVIAGGSKFRAREVIVAAGGWSGRIVPALQGATRARRIISTWFPSKTGSTIRRSDGPIFIRETGGRHVSGIPDRSGSVVKVNLVGRYRTVEPDKLDRTVTRGEAGAVEDAVRELLPDLVPSAVRTGAYMDAFTSDGHGLLGRLDGVPRLTVATGFSGHGFKMASALGEVAAAVALGDRPAWEEVRRLSPSRRSASEVAF